MNDITYTACVDHLPPLGVWKHVYLGDHDQCWIMGRLESREVWELDTTREGVPHFVDVDRELVTHWMDELPCPFDVANLPAPPVVDGRFVARRAIK